MFKNVIVYSTPGLRDLDDEIEITYPRSRGIEAVGVVVGLVRAGQVWNLSAPETLPANGMDRLLVRVVAGGARFTTPDNLPSSLMVRRSVVTFSPLTLAGVE